MCVTKGGQVWCSGFGGFGELGTKELPERSDPTLASIQGVAELSAGPGHTCALLTDGQVACWGLNAEGESGPKLMSCKDEGASVGSGQIGCQPTPTVVPGVSGVLQLATAGPRSCALTDKGLVTCWGRTLEPGSALAQMGLRHFAMVDLLACVQTMDGTVRCPHIPFDVVSGWKNARQIVLGETFGACALLDSGRVECWQGGSGAGSVTRSALPPSGQDPTADLPIQLAAGGGQVCALKAGGSVWCWGRSDAGAELCGPAPCAETAVRIDGLPPARHVASGPQTSCAVTDGNRLYCWGRRLTTATFGGPLHIPGPWE
jgi:hypothetical protein